jgi:hypothetical protein
MPEFGVVSMPSDRGKIGQAVEQTILLPKKSMAERPSKYDVLNRPSQKVIDVGAALHRASQTLGLFKDNKG